MGLQVWVMDQLQPINYPIDHNINPSMSLYPFKIFLIKMQQMFQKHLDFLN